MGRGIVNRYVTARRLMVTALIASLLIVATFAGRLWTRASAATTAGHIQTVFIILMENHNWSQIRGSKYAPYINSLISGSNDAHTSYMSNYYNPPGNHPSLPNYLWLEDGQCFTYCGTDSDPRLGRNGIGATHLVTLLNSAGLSWKAYEEGDPGGCPTANSGEYAVRHDPFVYFDDVNGRSSYCSSHVVDYSNLARDLHKNTPARYNFITPNLCDDMHDHCNPLTNSIKQGDTWLKNNAPPIINWVMAHNGALFITWDEAANGDGPIGMIAVSPFARGHGFDLTSPNTKYAYTHSSTLRTLEEIFRMSSRLGDSKNASDLSHLFTRFP
ncbi:MAG TPA: alkaline phosphatase family protein [Chloroflexota bacterium]